MKFNFRNWKIFANKSEVVQLNRFEDEILTHIGRKKELELDLLNAQTQIKAERESFELKLREKERDFEMDMQRLRSEFSLEKKQVLAQMTEDRRKQEFDLSLKEKELLAQKQLEITKLKNENEAAIAKLKNDSDQKTNAEIIKMQTELQRDREKMIKENYDTLTAALTKIHEQGNYATKIVHDLSMKMLDKTPDVHRLSIDATRPADRKEVKEVNVEVENG